MVDESDLEPIERIPPLHPALLKVLGVMYPERIPKPDDTERQDMYNAGQRSVVLFLQRTHDDQMERARDQMR